MDSERAIIAIAVLKGWLLHQFDAATAFLHGDNDAEIYMELPEDFKQEGWVCRIRRSLYGLKQAPRIRYNCVHRTLTSNGFFMARTDTCVFYKQNCVACVYVDDFLVAGANREEIDNVCKTLECDFKMNDLGNPAIIP